VEAGYFTALAAIAFATAAGTAALVSPTPSVGEAVSAQPAAGLFRVELPPRAVAEPERRPKA
jgi:hypothetical protein